uniref:Uncharacterized protein n=1 Tax=Timema bartmani TaxID=61472 RepID=A0A7R9EWX8_9NEOP|nr:unnamed protein product [Timema bartmani]
MGETLDDYVISLVNFEVHQDACWNEEVVCSALDQIEKEEYNRVKCLNGLEKKSYNVVLSEEASNVSNVIVLDDVCSHGRSKDYFVESITSPITFNATLCYSWNDYIKGRCKDNPTVAMGAYTPTRVLNNSQKTYTPFTDVTDDYSKQCVNTVVGNQKRPIHVVLELGLRSAQLEWGVEACHMLDQSVKRSCHSNRCTLPDFLTVTEYACIVVTRKLLLCGNYAHQPNHHVDPKAV